MNRESSRRAPLEWLSTVGGLGYIGKAPGTFGSLPGLVVGWLILNQANHFIPYESSFILVCLLLLSFVGFHAIKAFEGFHGNHDDQRIVIDEVVGQAFAVCMIGNNLKQLAIAFVLFRLFDITKPGPIGWADKRLKGSWGTLLDDILAGIIAGGVYVAAKRFGFPF